MWSGTYIEALRLAYQKVLELECA